MDDPSATASLHNLAIEAALNCDWEKAVELNKQIAAVEPNNIACLNRLAKALFELKRYQEAKDVYQEVLALDPYNQIAQKNLKRLANCKNNQQTNQSNGIPQKISPNFFLQEPGITKIVNLIRVAEPQKLSTIFSGMEVKIVPKNRSIHITDQNGSYLGALPDDLSFNLLKLLKGGNKYEAFVKSVKPNGLSILIRETYRSKRFRNQPSFKDELHVISFASDHLPLNEDYIEEEELGSEESQF